MSFKSVVHDVASKIYDGDIPENDIQAKALLKLAYKMAETADEWTGKAINANTEHASTLKTAYEEYKSVAEDSRKLWSEKNAIEQKVFAQEQRLAKSGKSTKDRFEHITVVAGIVIGNYINANPDCFDGKKFKRGTVKVIDSLIAEEMMKPINLSDANLKPDSCLDERTLLKHRTNAVEILVTHNLITYTG